MARRLVMALALPASGCIIPTPLERDVGNGAVTPIIVSGMPEFDKPEVYKPGFNTAFKLSLTATDGNVEDGLGAALYYDENGEKRYLLSIPLTPVADDPTRRTGSFPELSWCRQTVADGPRRTVWFYVYVSDQGAELPTDPAKLVAGHFDYKYWLVNCE